MNLEPMNDAFGILALWLLAVTGWGLATVFGISLFHELKDRQLERLAAKQANARARKALRQHDPYARQFPAKGEAK